MVHENVLSIQSLDEKTKAIAVCASDSSDDKCPICLDLLSEGVTVRLRRCQHVLHEHCRAKVAASKFNICPVCRCRGVNFFEHTGAGPSAG